MSDEAIYEAWHRNLGHSEYRVTITMAGYGDDDDAAGAFLDGWLATHPEVGPVISQNSEEDSISSTISLQTSGEDRAVTLASSAWIEAGVESGLEPGDILRVEVERIDEPEQDCAVESGESVYA